MLSIARLRAVVGLLFQGLNDRSGLFVEQLEDRCYLSAMPVNEMGPAFDIGSHPTEQPPEVSQGSAESFPTDSPIRNLDFASLPSWAQDRIAADEGSLINAWQTEDDALLIQLVDENGRPELLYNDADLSSEVSLIDFLESRLNVQSGMNNRWQVTNLVDVNVEAPANLDRLIISGSLEVSAILSVPQQIGFSLSIDVPTPSSTGSSNLTNNFQLATFDSVFGPLQETPETGQILTATPEARPAELSFVRAIDLRSRIRFEFPRVLHDPQDEPNDEPNNDLELEANPSESSSLSPQAGNELLEDPRFKSRERDTSDDTSKKKEGIPSEIENERNESIQGKKDPKHDTEGPTLLDPLPQPDMESPIPREDESKPTDGDRGQTSSVSPVTRSNQLPQDRRWKLKQPANTSKAAHAER